MNNIVLRCLAIFSVIFSIGATLVSGLLLFACITFYDTDSMKYAVMEAFLAFLACSIASIFLIKYIRQTR